MALPISSMKSQCFYQICTRFKQQLLWSPSTISYAIPNFNSSRVQIIQCRAAKSQTEPVKKRSSSSSSRKKKKGKNGADNSRAPDSSDFEIEDFSIVERGPSSSTSTSTSSSRSSSKSSSKSNSNSNSNPSLTYHPTSLPKPPAGFVVDDQGTVLMASKKRIATLVDPETNTPLECVIRRVFRNSQDNECMLLSPVDTPIQFLKSTNGEGWSAVSDEEAESIFPAASYALAKINMYLVDSGYCYTARGGFCYSEDDIFDFHTDDDKEIEGGMPTEGVEITWFNVDGAHYMLYTPSDPVLFAAVKDKDGILRIIDDEQILDPAIASAVDEETEFNALVEEEAALFDSVTGKR